MGFLVFSRCDKKESTNDSMTQKKSDVQYQTNKDSTVNGDWSTGIFGGLTFLLPGIGCFRISSGQIWRTSEFLGWMSSHPRNSWFTYSRWWFSIAFCMFTRGYFQNVSPKKSWWFYDLESDMSIDSIYFRRTKIIENLQVGLVQKKRGKRMNKWSRVISGI